VIRSAVRRLATDDTATASGVLAAAFQEDAMMVHLLPDPARRRRVLPVYFAAVLRQASRRGQLYVATHDDTVAAVAIAMPAGTYPIPVLPQLREWRAIAATGALGTLRNFRDLPPIDRARPAQPFHYLMYLGTRPDLQAHGHGAALVEQVLADADAVGHPSYLVTMRHANLAFYARFGLAVRTELRLGRHGPAAWSLIRPSPAQTTQ